MLSDFKTDAFPYVFTNLQATEQKSIDVKHVLYKFSSKEIFEVFHLRKVVKDT